MQKLLLLCAGFLLLFSPSFSQPGEALKGVIKYQGEKSMPLRGEWKFYWNKFLMEDSLGIQTEKSRFVTCPSIWNNADIYDENLPSAGFATYVLDVFCEEDFPDMAIEVPVFYSSYALFLNGHLIAKNGIPGKTKGSSEPEWKPLTKTIELHKGTNQLVLEVSNYDHSKGGFFAEMHLGTAGNLVHKREMNLIVVMFIIGSLFVVGVFNLAMYAFWRKDAGILFYALFAISFAARLSTTGLIVLVQLFDGIPGLVAIKIEYISFYLIWMFLALFAGSNFKEDVGKWYIRIIVGVSLAVAIATLVLPLQVYSQLITPYVYLGLVMLGYGIYLGIKILVNKRHGSLFFAIGIILVFIVALLTASMYLVGTPVIAYTHNLVLLLAFLFISFMLAKRFGLAYRSIEKLHKESLEQKMTIENLSAAQSRWFINIAHELRTPLTLIQGPIRQFLKKHNNKSDLSLSSIEMANKNSEILLKLVNEILDVSKLESDRLSLNTNTVDLTELISGCLAYFKESAKEKGVSLSKSIPASVSVSVDRHRIQNILINLLANALKFTHRGGSIEVRVTFNPEKDVFIAVADTGDGIPEKDIEHVFERYYQVSDAKRINQGGIGIGLSFSREVAELHGGSLNVESKLDMGSTFTLHLPAELVKNTKSESGGKGEIEGIHLASYRELITEPGNNDAQKPLILLVEDNADMRKYISSIIPEKYSLKETVDGHEALDFIADNDPELIISDVMMPRIDGFELLKTLRSKAATENIPVIMLTAHAAREDKLKALCMGVDDYLTKPFDEEELLARMYHLIHHKRQKKQWIDELPEEEREDTSPDREFLLKAEAFATAAISNYNYSVLDLAEELKLSERQLFRKVKSATGMSPLQYIREIRLQKARMLLEGNNTETISEVMFAVGFRKSDYFARLYRERFGKLPSQCNTLA